MPKKPRNAAMSAIHETASDLYRSGGIDQKTMRKFDPLCLMPIEEMSPQEIPAFRTRETQVKLSLLPTPASPRA